MNENENERVGLNERARRLFARIGEFFGRLSRRTKMILAAIVLIAAGVLVFLLTRPAERPYAVLFTDLSSDDMTRVLSYLSENSVSDYKIENNNRILVPSGQEARLKTQIMLEVYPTSGFGYDLYLSNVGSLSSDSDRRILWQADLQERLAASIRYIPGVRSAQVFITPGEDRRYILSTDDVVQAKASVIVEMSGNRVLTDEQAAAIRALVARAVQGLEITEVSIVDSAGITYLDDEKDDGAASDSATLKLMLESRWNAYMKDKVLTYLEGIFGAGNVTVTVSSTVDVNRRYEEATIYENPAWADAASSGEGIIGNRSWGGAIVRDDDGTGAGGVVGTTTNADLYEYINNQAENLDGSERELSAYGSINYDVTTRRTQEETVPGYVTDLRISVAVNSDAVEIPNMADFTHVVAAAAGIPVAEEAEKVAVMAYPFYVTPEPPVQEPTVEVFGLEIPGWVIYALIAGVILFVILLVIILLIRRALRRRRARIQAEREAAEAAAAAAAAAEAAAAEAAAAAAEAAEYEYEELGEGEEPEPGDEIIFTSDGKRRRRRRVIKVAAGAGDGKDALYKAAESAGLATEGADIMDIHTEEGMALRKDIRKFVEDNPAIAAQMLKNWLRGSEEDNA